MTAIRKKTLGADIPQVQNLQSVTEGLLSDTGRLKKQSRNARMQIGQVISVSGDRLLIILDVSEDKVKDYMPRIGGMICIETGTADLIATVSGLSSPAPGIDMDAGQILIAELELLGAFHMTSGHVASGDRRIVRRGVTVFPALGDVAAAMTEGDLAAVYAVDNPGFIEIGKITNADDTPAMIDPGNLLNSNFAMLGVSGSGKSCAIAVLTRALVKHRHPARTIIIDPHNEYSRSFGRAANILKPASGMIAYWMLDFKELVYLFEAHGGAMTQEEQEALGEGVCTAKKRLMLAQPTPESMNATSALITVDMPVPYRLNDVMAYFTSAATIDGAYDSEIYRRLRLRVENIGKNHQYKSIFSVLAAQDTLSDVVGAIFRMPLEGKPITIVQFDNLLPEICEVIVSFITRFASVIAASNNGQTPFLLILEEAQKFAPASENDAPVSSEAITQLLEKSSKLAVCVGLVSSNIRNVSRPIIEQCKTLFAMRMTSKADQEFLYEVTPESATGLLSGVGVLGRSEAIAIGTGMQLPIRLQFSSLPQDAVPREVRMARSATEADQPPIEHATAAFVGRAIDTWRYQ